ncbi:MAG: SDR family oxidoreductase, partial [Candidatus Aminicenantes bacterium]|nr:SDR family oxidoreductase [Candidatus Aminicenantes bacterium]
MSLEIMGEGTVTGLEIAVVGMAGRFPGAKNIAQFWDNLKKGVESITFFSDPELEEAGIDPEIIKNPQYVKALGFLEDVEYFDAAFFDYIPAEARVMDPQIRIFHECAWTALEDSGYNPGNYQGFIGLYVGAALGFNWQLLSLLSGAEGTIDSYAASLVKDKDFIATRVSYKLNLKGPSFALATACSTSLVAVNLACQGLLSGECDMALAGGAKVIFPQKSGYIYREGMIPSPDGHCHAFDAAAKGTVSGSGVGVVVLKLLEQAIADRDHIYAVIKGTATNNDGFRKAGFTAPSIDGQAEVVRDALRMAAVEPESIGYVEAHGTGTTLGDPVEIAALKLAFDTKKKGYCALGSVKTNVGHLDSAAGIASFIKTVLILKHKLIPANLHFTAPNLQIDFENSPFYVNNKLSEWKNDKHPLKAGVSSFGIGGTNAHVILEEYKSEIRIGFSSTPQLILLSAKTPSALDKQVQNLADFFKKNPVINIADAAYTLQIGRKSFKYRKMFCCSTTAEAAFSLASADPEQVKSFVVRKEDRPVIFMFSGQGSQYVNMGLELYRKERIFREEMDRCFEIIKPLVGFDLKEILYPKPPAPGNPAEKTFVGEAKDRRGLDINSTEIAQPVIFIVEYALARLLMKWGIKPKAMIGHSIGEYAAASLSGVFSLEDALKLVIQRGKLMQQMPPGSMLGVAISEEELSPLLKNKSLALAAVNSSKQCVISGSHKAVEAFAKELEERGYKIRHLHTSHAFHSQMMAPMLTEFKAKVKEVKLNKPKIPYISNVSGNWIKTGEATDPGYWSKQIHSTVRFADGLQKLFKEEDTLLVEIGPGKVLCTFVRQHNDKKTGHQTINLVRHPQEDAEDNYYLLNRLGQCWLYGVEIDWTGYHDEEKHYRIPLPTYPFDRRHYWIEGNPFKIGMEMMSSKTSLRKKTDMADWFYIPSWERISPEISPNDSEETPACWLIFIEQCESCIRLIERLKQEKKEIFTVRRGSGFERLSSGEYIIDPAECEDYHSLFRELKIKKKVLNRIVHFWSVTGSSSREPDLGTIDQIQDTGLFSLLNIVQAIGNQGITADIRIAVVSDGLQDVTGEEVLCPLKATLLGAVKIIPLEYPNIACKSIDIPTIGETNLDSSGIALTRKGLNVCPSSKNANKFIEILLQELNYGYNRKIVAVRGNYCWVPVMKPVRLEDVGDPGRCLKERGVYLITGGMGGMGFTLADHLAHSMKARLILLGRSPFPPRQEWDNWLSNNGEEDGVSIKIQKIRKWEEAGAEVMIFSADISNLKQVQEILTRAKEKFGKINGVLHTAGLADYEGVIQRRTREKTETIMAPKVKGTLVLDKVLKDLELDFLVLFSSIGNILYKVKFGQVGYNAANEFLDAYACYKTRKDRVFTTAVNWCDWLEVGMSVAAVERRVSHEAQNPGVESLLYGAATPGEGVEIFNRILASNLVRVSVSTQDLDVLLNQADSEKDEEPGSMGAPVEAAMSTSSRMIRRPDLSSEYAAPGNEIEEKLAGIWQGFFGIDQVGIHDDFFELGGD